MKFSFRHSIALSVLFAAILCLLFFVQRSDFLQLLIAYCIAFTAYLFLLKKFPENLKLKQLLIAGLLIRIAASFAFPNLSDDLFRFLWDGGLINSGLNPFMHLPKDLVESGEMDNAYSNYLYANLNSPNYYSVYPPLNQFFFAIADYFSQSNIWAAISFLRLPIILADLGIAFFLGRFFNLKIAFAFAFNPLILIELTGNLHFEGLMIFFLLISFLLIKQGKILYAALAFAFSILVKLLPLILLPLLMRYLGWRKGLVFVFFSLVLVLLAFLPFDPPAMALNMMQSIQLYFQNFEFNASFYYLAREIGFSISGYNQIALVGPLLSLISFSLILIISLRRIGRFEELYLRSLLIFTVYFLLTTTVHPWYIATVLVLGLLCKMNYAIIWSFLVILSYHMYSQNFVENLWLIGLEYSLLFITIGLDLSHKNKSPLL